MNEYDKTMYDEMLTEHNAYRKVVKLTPLVMNQQLMIAAKSHADYMDRNGSMTHMEGWIWSKNRTVANRAKNNGYQFTFIGENIAWGQHTVMEVMKTWWNSPPHKSNILGNYADVGFARTGDYWCVVFGKS